jgi:SAM-dependent methyltransferase
MVVAEDSAEQNAEDRAHDVADAGRSRVRGRLVLASALMLFLELALIRWTASNIIHLGYFSNFVLLGSFLGVGLGFLRAARSERAPLYFPFVLALLVVVILRYPVTVDRAGSDLIFFTSLRTSGPPIWLILPVVFAGVAAVMAGPGELVARCFRQLPRLDAYRFDLLGSLCGIAGFSLLSLLRAPSVVWGSVVAALTAVLLWRPSRTPALALSLGTLIGALLVESTTAGVSWSPYYKVATTQQGTGKLTVVTVSVNGVPHQAIMDAQEKAHLEPQYAIPYERMTQATPGRVLVVGAGTGNDVALALLHGATSVDAVEIDPRLVQIGRQRNPDHPYADPRVHVHVNDGRAFLERTNAKYDLIVFALPDSLTLVAGASSLRLESYLFTVQAMRSVHSHLAPGGAFAMYNYYRDDWLVGRLARTVGDGFGHQPCVDMLGGVDAVITAGLTPQDQHCAAAAAPVGPAPATDDWPFVYLHSRSVPGFYLIALLGILLASALAVRVVGGPLRRLYPYRDLFLLGAAFLLLETRAITGFALLFGTTWVVNAIVFGGVLVAVLVAVEITRHWRTPRVGVLYASLAGALALAAAVRPETLLSLPVVPRALASTAIAFLPVLVANLVFAKRFERSPDGTAAFGANRLGAILGGCLEYLSLAVGYQALLILAGLLYAGAFALLPRGSRATT